MGKQRRSPNSSTTPGRRASIRSGASSILRSDGREFFDNIPESVLNEMTMGPTDVIRCLQEFRNRLVSGGLFPKLEMEAAISSSLEDEMEDDVMTVMSEPDEERALSTLTHKEITSVISLKMRGTIQTNDDFNFYPVPEFFEESLTRTLGMVLRVNDAGNRMIIEEYIKCAIVMARQHLLLPALYVCPDMPLPSEDLGVDGLRDVSGKVDYATALADTGPNTALALKANILNSSPVVNTLCSLFQAKSPSTDDYANSEAAEAVYANGEAEAVGGLLLLSKHPTNAGHNGVYSDGFTCVFMRLVNGWLYATGPLTAWAPEDRRLILNILLRWVAGRDPYTDSFFKLVPPPPRRLRSANAS